MQEVERSTPSDGGHPQAGPTVEIKVDGKEYQIHKGHQPVSAIKTIAHVPLAYQLDEDIKGVLTPLDANGTVDIKGDEVFVSYPATGTSS